MGRLGAAHCTWLILGLAGLGLAANLALAVYAYRQPSDGWRLAIRPDSVVFVDALVRPVPAASPIQAGDTLLVVDDRPVRAWLGQAMHAEVAPPVGWHADGRVAYIIARDGAILTIDVPLMPLSWPGIEEPPTAIPLPLRLAAVLLGLVVLLRRPSDRAARLFFLFMYVWFLGLPGSLATTRPTHQLAEIVVPWLFWPAVGLQEVGFALGLTLLLHLFLVFPREKAFVRRHPGAIVGLYALYPTLTVVNVLWSWGDPLAFWGRQIWLVPHVPYAVGLAVGAVTGAVHSYRTAPDPLARQQAAWIAWGLTLALAPLLGLALIATVLPDVSLSDWWRIPALTFVLFPVSVAIAILRAHLWDIELVLRRTLVYGALTGAILLLYAAAVALTGLLLHAIGGADLAVALLGAAAVAALFQPLRERVQRGVNRLLYGERESPYDAVARLGHRLAASLTSEAVLPAIVEDVARALRLPHASIWLIDEDTLRLAASAGRAPAATMTQDAAAVAALRAPAAELCPADDAVGLPFATAMARMGVVLGVPLTDRGELVGVLCLAPRSPGEAFTAADRRLLRALASQAGPAVHAVQLTGALQASLAALRRSRERLIAAQEEERRRIQRDLHDGLGPTLAGMRLRLEACLDLAQGTSPRLIAELERLDALVGQASADIRRLVHDLRPAVLDQLGLVPALRQHIERFGRDTGLTVHLTADAHLAVPPAAEVAIYRVVQEALVNVQKHARAGRVDIRLGQHGEWLVLAIRDDGVGLTGDGHGADAGTGLRGIQERADLLGGVLEVTSQPQAGTELVVRVPARG
jgi:signal transduction histidine kinase